MGVSGEGEKNGQTAKTTEMDVPLRINIKHYLSLFSKESEESWGREEGGRQAGRSEESGRAAREGDQGIREMESRERKRKRDG